MQQVKYCPFCGEKGVEKDEKALTYAMLIPLSIVLKIYYCPKCKRKFNVS